MTRGVSALVALSLALATTPVDLFAQQAVPRARSTSTATARTTNGSRATMVIGTAWNAETRPIPNARVRLRNISTGQVAAQATTNQQGEFTFSNVPSGTYVTELVDGRGSVVAIGESFTIAPGQTVITFVRLPPRKGGFLFGVWGAAAAAAVAAAVGLGISAVEACGDCAVVKEECPECPPCDCPPISCEVPGQLPQ